MKRIATSVAAALMLQACATNPPMTSTPAAAPPHSSSTARQQISEALESGDRAQVTRGVIDLAAMGGALSDASFDRVTPLLDPATLGDPRAWYGLQPSAGLAQLRSRFHDNALVEMPPAADLVATVPAEYRLVEGIAWDAARKRLFVSTVIDGRLAYLENGAWHEVQIASPRGGLFGMSVDRKRRLLWIATGVLDQVAVTGERMTGLIAVDLDTLKVVRRVPVTDPKPGMVGDLTVAPDGTVFASNSVSGAIHRCRPGCTELEALVPAGRFNSPQGLALSPRGDRLYVADYDSGLWMVDTTTGAVSPFRVAQPIMLDGIDGLIAAQTGGALIAIQNGTRPRRILKLYPSSHRGPDTQVTVLRRLSPEGPEPTLGTLVGGYLYYVGDAQWERYGPAGAIKDGQPARGTPIYRIAVTNIAT
ncbi:hypothetical protein P1X14_01325 [Sphingomonas sp. AOB5]|uniref:SMP-30/gluconolactonase/LRE family protein n=1 Tax=Sphingomonas sp. AOB5 TaxID=3034017 RepID=UPI0023F90DCF|nr:hypothetical protein [Sphingomonas sp. AOB5]MDF7773872.1 hypothetical protein [Sphingomonas sp. AOB5]